MDQINLVQGAIGLSLTASSFVLALSDQPSKAWAGVALTLSIFLVLTTVFAFHASKQRQRKMERIKEEIVRRLKQKQGSFDDIYARLDFKFQEWPFVDQAFDDLLEERLIKSSLCDGTTDDGLKVKVRIYRTAVTDKSEEEAR